MDNATREAKMKDKVSNEAAPVKNIEKVIGKQPHELEDKYSRLFPRDTKDEDIRECNFVPLRIEEEIQVPTWVEEKKNALANEEELLMEKRQVEEQHL